MTLSSVSLMALPRIAADRGPQRGFRWHTPSTPVSRGGFTVELKSLTEQKSLLATLPPGKRARLYRLLYEFGPGHGTRMPLPIDQGIEHGPRDFFPNPASKDPDYQFALAAPAGYPAPPRPIGVAGQDAP